MKEIVTRCTICNCRIDLSSDIGKLAFSSSSNGLENLALAVNAIMSDAKRPHIPTRQKPNAHRSTSLQKLWLRMAGTQAQFNYFLRTTSPTFNQSSADLVLYNLVANYPAVFHDITTGNNSLLCTSDTANSGTNEFLTGYNSGTGYDLATGIGSIDVSKLVADWGKASHTTTTTTLTAGTISSSLSSSALTVANGATACFKVSENSTSAPCNVALYNNDSQPNNDAITVALLGVCCVDRVQEACLSKN